MLINRVHKFGISISYECVVELKNSLANSICLQFEEEGVVCPAHLRKGLRTIRALDNLDHKKMQVPEDASAGGCKCRRIQVPEDASAGGNCEQ